MANNNATLKARIGAALSRCALWAVCGGVLYAAGAQAQTAAGDSQLIGEIRFVGNDTTRPEVLLQEMVVRPGDPVDWAAIRASEQAIMDLGLFKEVSAELLPAADHAILQVRVVEKYFFLALPRLDRNAEGDLTYGLSVRFDNLAGLNQRLRLSARTRQRADDFPSEDRFSVTYHYPRVAGSSYGLELSGGWQETLLAVHGNAASQYYRGEVVEAAAGVSRWLARGPAQGWWYGAGLAWRTERYEFLAAESENEPGVFDPVEGGTAFGVTLGGGYQEVHRARYSRTGLDTGYRTELGVPGINGGYDRHHLFYRRYHRLPGRPHTNLDANVELGLSSGRPFDRDTYSLGGSSSLRGYERDVFHGNAFVLANLEYATPVSLRFPALRAVVFLDAGNAYPGNRDIDLGRLKFGGGVGLRWTVQAFVDIDLSVDLAYGFSDGRFRSYGYTSELF